MASHNFKYIFNSIEKNTSFYVKMLFLDFNIKIFLENPDTFMTLAVKVSLSQRFL